MTQEDHADAARLSEDVAHRLLARAVELDASRSSEITIAQLRDAAMDAGISVTAFDAAVSELRRGEDRGTAHVVAPARSVGKRISEWLRGVDPAHGTGVLEGALLRNVVAFAAFWGILLFLVSIDRASDVQWLVRKATDPVALALGAAVAARLRARPVGVLLAGLAIATGAEFVMDAMLRAPSVQGFGSHWALMIAGVAGVLLGGKLFRRPPVADAVRNDSPAPSATADERAAPPSTNRRAIALTLRTT